MITIERTIRINRERRGRKAIEPGERPVVPPRLPRVATLMALALRLDELVRTGEASDYAELARRETVTRARVTQVMNLLQLSPAIQEALLFLPAVDGRAPIILRDLQPIAAEADWKKQWRMWKHLLP